MHLPPPPSLPPRHDDSHCGSGEDMNGGILSGGIHGQVTIHPSATIAPTALLQAELNSHLVLGAGVCVGSSTVLHAHGGTLEIESGVSLGSAVLLIGSGKIGANACVGSMVTIINPAIASGEVVIAGTLWGDSSRSVELLPSAQSATAPSTNGVALVDARENPAVASSPSLFNPAASNSVASNPAAFNPAASNFYSPNLPQNGAGSNGKIETHTLDSQEDQKTQLVPGKAAFNELMTALFPHRQTFEKP